MERTFKRLFILTAAALLLSGLIVNNPTCLADLSSVGPGGDGNVTINDVGSVLEAIELDQYDSRADVNKDGKVDREDLDIIMQIFERSTGDQSESK